MTQEAEELQTKEYLERTEIRTMRKDLQKLREVDALQERDKIIKIKTPEEELSVRKLAEEKIRQSGEEKTHDLLERNEREKILQKNTEEEKEAKVNLKNYANESEKQQIFLFESQRFDLENQIKTIEDQKDPALKLEKNRILLIKGDWEKRLNTILEEEKKLETEQKYISEKEKESSVATEKQSLEKRRWDLEKDRQEIEKKRWEIERELVKIENQVKKIDEDYEKITAEKNSFRDKKSEIDKVLRDIYSKIISGVESQRAEKERDRRLAQGEVAEKRAEEKEKIQRDQWKETPGIRDGREKEFLKRIPTPAKEKLFDQAKNEEEDRKKFMESVKKWAEEDKK
ncbi:MAG: hypothetical protein Q8O66_00125 [bacterium]|nr:hypothetical protein [bacterium]